MMFKCYVIYFIVESGFLVDFGVVWFGWDFEIGKVVLYFDLVDLFMLVLQIIVILCKYGFYVMMKFLF